MAKRLTNNELGVAIGNYNILTTFATRYALGQPTLCPDNKERIIEDSLDVLHEQTKHGIIRDIEDYIDQHENIDDLATWQRIMEMLKERFRKEEKRWVKYSLPAICTLVTPM